MTQSQVDKRRLEFIFGRDSRGETIEARASSSARQFIRSQDHLAVYSDKGNGRVLSAWEALHTFGLDTLEKAVADGSVIIPASINEPADTLRTQRTLLGLDVGTVANFAGVPTEVVLRAEDPLVRSSIRDLGRIARVLGLDDRLIAAQPGAGGDKQLAVRLRTLTAEAYAFTPRAVLALGEAAWVIRTQHLLQSWLLDDTSKALRERFKPSGNYGSPGYPNWQQAHYLAVQTRRILGLSESEPIENLRTLCEYDLGIPVVQIELPESIAGVTLRTGVERGVALNLSGLNRNVWIRRATLAHELGHLLWDPDEELTSVRVDRYVDISAEGVIDRVEQRANAFAAEFLAPQRATLEVFEKYSSPSDGLRAVMEEFGISFTVARYQIYNASDRRIDFGSLVTERTEPTAMWTARENWTADYFPVREVPLSRRGDFAAAVATAEKERFLSLDTAADYLACDPGKYSKSRDDILKLFPAWSDGD